MAATKEEFEHDTGSTDVKAMERNRRATEPVKANAWMELTVTTLLRTKMKEVCSFFFFLHYFHIIPFTLWTLPVLFSLFHILSFFFLI